MDDRDREHLGRLIEHAQAAIGYARARRDWWTNPETLDAILMRISQVGEAASKASPAGLSEVSGVTWRNVKGIRAKRLSPRRRGHRESEDGRRRPRSWGGQSPGPTASSLPTRLADNDEAQGSQRGWFR